MEINDAVLNATIDSLRMFSFASISIAFMCDLYQTREAVLSKKLLFYALLIAGLAFYNAVLDGGVGLFELMRDDSGKKIDQYLAKCTEAHFEAGGGMIKAAMIQLQGMIFKLLTNATSVLRMIGGFIQAFLVILLKVLAPIVFGVAAWHVYRGILQQFVLYTLATAMWSVGYCIADIAILNLVTIVGIPAALKGAATVLISGGPVMAAVLVFLLIIFLATCVFYILTPFIIFKVLSGGNPAEAVNSNMRTAAMATMAGAGGAIAASKNVLSHSGSGAQSGAANPINTTSSSTGTGGSPNRAPTASGRIAARMREMQQKQRLNK